MRTPQSHTARENPPSQSTLEDLRMPVQAKLAAAWTSFMFLVIYIDYFHLYKPGAIDQIRGGVIFVFDISGTLLTVFVAVIGDPGPDGDALHDAARPGEPRHEPRRCIALHPRLVFNAAGASWDWAFFYGLSIGVEVLILAFILRSAWTWPRRTASPATLAASLDSEPLRTPQQA